MRVNDSDRIAFVTESENIVVIHVSQPSDCLILQRDHVVCADIVTIKVHFGDKFTSGINGSLEPESSEVWQTALQHLLNTYKPFLCYIFTNSTETGLDDEVRVQTGSNRLYNGFWNENRSVLSFLR